MLLAQDIVQNTQITSNYYLLTLLVALPTPSNTAFTFWMRESSLHRTFIRMPYAVHKGIICLHFPSVWALPWQPKSLAHQGPALSSLSGLFPT